MDVLDHLVGDLDRPPRRYRPDSEHRREIERRDRAFLEVMRAHPEASASALADVLGCTKATVVGRWYRLGRAGALIKCAGGRWRLSGPADKPSAEPDDEASEFEAIEHAPLPPYVPGARVQHVDRYVRISTSLFACARFG
jgi:hypothetical protein